MTMAYLIAWIQVRVSTISGLYVCVREDLRQKLCGNKAEEVLKQKGQQLPQIWQRIYKHTVRKASLQ